MPLNVSDGPEAWIHDFVNSDDPRFKGKSKEKRRQQALAAFYGAKRKKESSSLVSNAMDLLELDSAPTQDKRDLVNPANPYVNNKTMPSDSRYVTGGSSSPTGIASPAVPPPSSSMNTGGGMTSTATAVPSALPSMTADLTGPQGSLSTPATDLSTTSTYGSSAPKELNDLSKTRIAKADSLLLVSPRQLLDSETKDITCPYCGATGKDSYMHQHHFNQCKYKPGN